MSIEDREDEVHCYLGVENLNLTAPQKLTLLDGIKALGRNDSGQPCHRNHWRIRLDNEAMIFEALFEIERISIAAVKQRLADIFSVPVANVTHTTASTVYGPLVTFRYNSQNKARLVQFGGVTPTWDESRLAALQYVKDNQAAWEPAA
ncbi:MAG: hypothetical protein EHM23_28625 [Acidobacteria bacterium]|nr:MAG: hypothetical protein EHM23_28625 [Acidobacteriota bacterium]